MREHSQVFRDSEFGDENGRRIFMKSLPDSLDQQITCMTEIISVNYWSEEKFPRDEEKT